MVPVTVTYKTIEAAIGYMNFKKKWQPKSNVTRDGAVVTLWTEDVDDAFDAFSQDPDVINITDEV